MVTQQIFLPMIPDSAPIVVNISQYDYDAAGYPGRLFFNLINNGVAYDMDGATAIFQGKKPDGTTFAYPATVVNDSVVRVNVRQQMTAVSGRVICQLIVLNSDGQIGSFNVWLEVQPSSAAGGDPSQTDIPALIAQAHEYAEQAEQAAEDAQAWSANPPYIGANGNWFVYDTATEAYVDTGVYASGTIGSQWYSGTAVAGKDPTPTAYPTGIATAREHDMYLNKTEGAIYECTFGGSDVVALWAYVMTLTGGGGGGGTTDYNDLDNKPKINGVTLAGNKSSSDLHISVDSLSNTQITDPQAGQVLKYDGSKWVNASVPSGGMLPYLYIDSESGATVTVDQPDGTTITPTAAGSGHWECELTGGYGTYIIHSVLAGQGDATQSLVVDTVMEYHVTDTHYDHTVSFVAPSGSTVRIEGGTEIYTLTGTGSTQTQAVHSASTSFTVTVTMDGNGKPYTFTTPSTTGQTTIIPSGTFDFGTINVSVGADFVTAGSSITCVSGGTSCTPKTAASTLTFRVPTTGTWTISGEVSGTPYSTTAEVTALDTPVSVSLQTSTTIYVTMYGAANDTISYTDASGSRVASLDSNGSKTNVPITIASSMNINFMSNVARMPDDLSVNYAKTITITPETTEVRVMPDGIVLFWWGYEDTSKFTNADSSNGWSYTSYGFITPSFESVGKILMNSAQSSKYSGLATNNTYRMSAYSHLIAKGLSKTGTTYGRSYGTPTKTDLSNTSNRQVLADSTNTNMTHFSANLERESYVSVVTSGSSMEVYAWWIEDVA